MQQTLFRPESDVSSVTQVRIISPEDYQSWDEFILSHDAAGAYLTTSWKRALETGYGHSIYYLGAFDKEALKGVLPLVLIKPPFGRKYLVSLPYCDYGGLLAENSEVGVGLLGHATTLASELGAKIEIRVSEPNATLEQTASFAQVTAGKCRMLLELSGSAARMWKNFNSKLRSQIRRAMKNGLVRRIGNEELLADFYRVFARNMRDLGSPVHSEQWLRSVLVAFREKARVGVVYKDDTPAAAGILLMHGKVATIPWASSLREFNRLSPNMLLYWTLLEYAADSGFHTLDFGRSTPGEGTYLFKEQWGARPKPLYWYRQRVAGANGGLLESSSYFRSVLKWGWATLPVSAANTAGPLIRKYISR